MTNLIFPFTIKNYGKLNFEIDWFRRNGQKFLLNVAEHGFSGVLLWFRCRKRRPLLRRQNRRNFKLPKILTILSKLESPRKIMTFVPAQVVDIVINDLIPKLIKAIWLLTTEIFSWYRRRENFGMIMVLSFGVGVSGGEEGARHGCKGLWLEAKPKITNTFDDFEAAASASQWRTLCGTRRHRFSRTFRSKWFTMALNTVWCS